MLYCLRGIMFGLHFMEISQKISKNKNWLFFDGTTVTIKWSLIKYLVKQILYMCMLDATVTLPVRIELSI